MATRADSKHKRTLRAIAVFSAMALLSATMVAVQVKTDTGASARASIGQISKLKKERDEYKRKKQEIESRIDSIEFERMAEMDKKEVLDERIGLTALEIDNLNEIINQYSILISEKEYETIIAQNREEEQLARYKDRVRYMEENGVVTYIEIVFSSANFIDLRSRLDFVRDIMLADESSYLELKQAQANTIAAKEDLESIKSELDDERENLDQLKERLDEQLEEAHALILKLEADIETERELYDKVTEEEDRLQKEINAAEAELRRQQEAERQRQLAQQRSQQQSQQQSQGSGVVSPAVVGTGELMWPVAGGSVISHYGMRNGRMHQGLDIGAAHGVSVVASDAGTVITSKYGSGYGNYVVVSHGNGMTTVYAHLSKCSVSVGDSVSKGQQVGLIGSTGNATTPHLHFEVSVNGTRVNPMSKL